MRGIVLVKETKHVEDRLNVEKQGSLGEILYD